MKYLLLFLLCCFTQSAIAQNWAPLNTTDIYNYKADTAAAISHSLWIDSFDVLSADTFMYPNKIVKHISPSVALKNQSQFLGWQMTNRNNGMMYILVTDNSDITYYPSRNTGMAFFDATSSPVQGYVTSIDTATVLGVLDSVKTIELTTGDTIIASKNHGFVQYPMEYGSGKYYRLVGIEGGRNLGEHVAKFDDFFNYSIGDTFWYYMSHWAKMWNELPWTAPPVYEAKYALVIDTIYHSGDTTFLSKRGTIDYPYPINGVGYLIDSATFDINLLPNQLIIDTFLDGYAGYANGNVGPNDVTYNIPYLSVTENSLSYPTSGQNYYKGHSSYKTSSGRLVKQFDKFYSDQFLTSGDTLQYHKSTLGVKQFTQGLGMTKIETNAFEGGATVIMYAYRKAGDSTATIIDQYYKDLIIGINEPETVSFKLLGNPVYNTINLELETAEAHTLTLYNLSGQQLLQQQSESQTVSMDVATLPQGIYLLEVRNKNGVSRQRVVKL